MRKWLLGFVLCVPYAQGAVVALDVYTDGMPSARHESRVP